MHVKNFTRIHLHTYKYVSTIRICLWVSVCVCNVYYAHAQRWLLCFCFCFSFVIPDYSSTVTHVKYVNGYITIFVKCNNYNNTTKSTYIHLTTEFQLFRWSPAQFKVLKHTHMQTHTHQYVQRCAWLFAQTLIDLSFSTFPNNGALFCTQVWQVSQLRQGRWVIKYRISYKYTCYRLAERSLRSLITCDFRSDFYRKRMWNLTTEEVDNFQLS